MSIAIETLGHCDKGTPFLVWEPGSVTSMGSEVMKGEQANVQIRTQVKYQIWTLAFLLTMFGRLKGRLDSALRRV